MVELLYPQLSFAPHPAAKQPFSLFCAIITGFVYSIFLTSFGTIPAFDIFKHATRYIFMPLALA
jgi:hypothetical protein